MNCSLSLCKCINMKTKRICKNCSNEYEFNLVQASENRKYCGHTCAYIYRINNPLEYYVPVGFTTKGIYSYDTYPYKSKALPEEVKIIKFNRFLEKGYFVYRPFGWSMDTALEVMELIWGFRTPEEIKEFCVKEAQYNNV